MATPMGDDAPADPELFGMTDLEEALWGPERQAVRAAVLDRLDCLSATVQALIVAGLAPKEFACANSIANALATSRKFMLAVP